MAKRILIVEDELPVLEVFVEFFKILGLEISTAQDGEEAWRIFQEKGPFDIYLIDVKIPKIEGVQLARQIRERDPEGPILILSGLPADLHKEIGDIPKTGYLKKPATFQEIKDLLKGFGVISDD